MSDTREVLVVEDDDSTRSLLGAIVAHYGFHPSYANDGDAAMARLGDGFGGLMLLDLLLPGTDGFAIVRDLKVRDPAMLQRTIVVSAARDGLIRECPELLETWRIFRKPIDVAEFAAVLMACAETAKAATSVNGKRADAGLQNLLLPGDGGPAVLPGQQRLQFLQTPCTNLRSMQEGALQQC